VFAVHWKFAGNNWCKNRLGCW